MIKEVRENEIPACVKVIRESFQTVADAFGFTVDNAPGFTAFATTEDRLRWQMFGEHRKMAAYYDDGVIVGYYSLLQDAKVCELSNLCVLPAYRHRGIGEKLLNSAFQAAKEWGCEKCCIGIVEENTVLRTWYESFGFLHTGTKKFDHFPFTCGYLEKEL